MQEIDSNMYGPWALVTGASSGIGEEFARQAAANGLNVVLVAAARRASEGDRRRTDDASRDRDARPAGRPRQRQSLQRHRRRHRQLGFRPRHLQPGAGNPGSFISLPHDRLREIVRLNVFAHLDLAHHFGKKLAERGRGGLVLVSAVAAAGGLPYMANDSATKGLRTQPRAFSPTARARSRERT